MQISRLNYNVFFLDVNKSLELIDLPREIVAEIMSRISTKSLMRLKFVSKSWCSVIRCLAECREIRRALSRRDSFRLRNVRGVPRVSGDVVDAPHDSSQRLAHVGIYGDIHLYFVLTTW